MDNEHLRAHRFKSTEAAREAGRKGGIKSGESKRRKKQLVTQLKAVVQNPIANEKIRRFYIPIKFVAMSILTRYCKLNSARWQLNK